MGMVRAEAERVISSPPVAVYGVLADVRERARFLPPAFSNFHIESGGVGEGTVMAFTLTAGGRSRQYRMRMGEPEPGVLTETDVDSSLITTYTVSPAGESSPVQISTTWEGAKGVGGFFERTFAPRALQKLYADELRRLQALFSNAAGTTDEH